MHPSNQRCFLFLLSALAGAGVGFWVAPKRASDPVSSSKAARLQPPAAEEPARTENLASGTYQPLFRPSQATAASKAAGGIAPSAGTPAVADPAQAAAMVRLLRSLRSSAEAGQPLAEDEKAQMDLKAALDRLLRHLRQSELARSVFSRRDTEGYISTLVKITPPSVTEINTLKRMLAELSGRLPPGQRMQFQNESLLLLRQFVFAQDKVLVVFLTEHFAQSPAKAGNFHTHLTSRPADYWHHHNGEQIGVPAGERNYEGGPLPSPLSPAFRYYHLAANQ